MSPSLSVILLLSTMVAKVRLCTSAGAEVIRGAADGDLDAAGTVGSEKFLRHPSPELPLFRVRVVCAVLRQRAPVGASVHVDVFHADQTRAAAFGGSEDTGLQGGELCAPLRIRRVQGLIDDGGAPGRLDGEGGIAGVPRGYFDAVGHACLT